MNIGKAAKASGVSAKMIRYYESIGLLPAPARTASDYRDYGPHDVHRLRFVSRARELGFSLERIRELLRLWSDRDIGNAEVRRVANSHIAGLEEQATNLQELIATLRHLVKSCRGEHRAECPIMADLAEAKGSVPAPIRRKPPPPRKRPAISTASR